MHSKDLVKLALRTLSCNQKELSIKLGVSPTQISKWKNDEHMSHEMEQEIRRILNIGEDQDPSFILQAGSIEDAGKWAKLIQHLARTTIANEIGYDASPLERDLDFLCWLTFNTLDAMGVKLPTAFPKDLNPYFGDAEVGSHKNFESTEEKSSLWQALNQNRHSVLIRDIFNSLKPIWAFYLPHVEKWIPIEEVHEVPKEIADTRVSIDAFLLDLAACNLDLDERFATQFAAFKRRTLNDYTEWLTILKNYAFRNGIPLKVELLDMIHMAGGDSKPEAKADSESLRFSASRRHPDIYMNELLVGMRTIHQVLLAILEKLNIKDQWKLDHSRPPIGPPTATAKRKDRPLGNPKKRVKSNRPKKAARGTV